jgi:hypothetical protein
MVSSGYVAWPGDLCQEFLGSIWQYSKNISTCPFLAKLLRYRNWGLAGMTLIMTLYATVQTLGPCGANLLWPLRPLPFLHEVISLRAMAVTAHPSASISFIATLLSTGESLNGFILGKGWEG